MTQSEESKGEQETIETEKEEQLSNEAETQEEEPSTISRWLWVVVLGAAAGIILLLIYNFIHRPTAP